MKATKQLGTHALANLETQERYINQYAFDTIKKFIELVLPSLPDEEPWTCPKCGADYDCGCPSD